MPETEVALARRIGSRASSEAFAAANGVGERRVETRDEKKRKEIVK